MSDSPNALQPVNVLVVEDDEMNVRLMRVMLNIIGITNIYHCRRGSEVEAMAATMPSIELVLLDLQLPGEDGYQIHKRLRANPLFAKSRIAAVTAQVMASDVLRTEQDGFDSMLGKPLDFDRFPDQITAILKGERIWQPRY